MPASIDTINGFVREINAPGDVGTATARRHSKIPSSGVRQLPPPDETMQLFEYSCPGPYRTVFQGLLMQDDPPPQFVELTDTSRLYVIQQAKPWKGSSTSATSVRCAADLESEIYGCLEVDEPVDRERIRIFLPQFFLQGVPHMRYQRLTYLSPDVPQKELAMRPWTGGRLFLKHLYKDERVWFGTADSQHPDRDAPITPEHPDEIVLEAPAPAPVETIRLCAAQFGSFSSVEEAACTSRQQLRGMATYRIRYQNASSAVMAHGVIFDLAAEEATVTGRVAPDEAAVLYQQLSGVEDDGTDPNWWRFEIGRSLGAEEAVQAEDHRLTATSLMFHDAPSPPQSTTGMQL